jgi:hypothetical protein
MFPTNIAISIEVWTTHTTTLQQMQAFAPSEVLPWPPLSMQSEATDSLSYKGVFLKRQGYLLRSCPANIVTSLSPCLPAASRREGEGKKDIQKAAFGTKADVWW